MSPVYTREAGEGWGGGNSATSPPHPCHYPTLLTSRRTRTSEPLRRRKLNPLEPTESIATLVADARRGHGRAWDRLFRRFAPVVHGILLGSVPFADAEDLTQQVFETALGHLPGLRDDHAFPGWLARIARNAAADFHRRPSPATGIEPEDVPMAAPQEAQVDAQRVLQVIRGLPEAYRETLVLRLVEGLSGPEIAATTGLTEGSVRVNLHRGMALLREALAMPGHEEER